MRQQTRETWVARFRNGPCAGSAERHFCVGPVAHRLTLMPHPSGRDGWALVGIDELQPDVPWPEQVVYDCKIIDQEGDELVGHFEVAA
jgi:hypothetical protein